MTKQKKTKNKKKPSQGRRWFERLLLLVIISGLAYLGYEGYQKHTQTLPPKPIGDVYTMQPTTHDLLTMDDELTPPAQSDVRQARREGSSEYQLTIGYSGNGWMNLPVWYGMSDYALFRGGASLNPDMIVGQGNFVVLGHNVWDGSLFAQLHHMVNGEWVYFYDGELVYSYELTNVFDGLETDDWTLYELQPGETPRVTLITCIGDWGTPYRRFAIGELRDVSPARDMLGVLDAFEWPTPEELMR